MQEFGIVKVVTGKTLQQEESRLKQLERTFILCVDPETLLPFQINMGYKKAEFLDMDDRGLGFNDSPSKYERSVNNIELNLSQNGSHNRSQHSKVLSNSDRSKLADHKYPILVDQNYIFYYKIKQDLLIMHKLLEDTTAMPGEPRDVNMDKEHKHGDVSSFESHNTIFHWSFRNNPNAEAFRRSMLPFYLLKEDEDSSYPRYGEFSDLPRNLGDKTYIKVKIYLESDLLQKVKRSDQFNQLQNPIVFEQFYLLKTARQLVEETKHHLHDQLLNMNRGKNLRRMTSISSNSQESELKERLKEDLIKKPMILKFKKEEAFVYGDTQLIYFSDIREYIKRQEEIELYLIEPKNQESRQFSKTNFSFQKYKKMFPPIVNTMHLEQEMISEHPSDSAETTDIRIKRSLNDMYLANQNFFWYPPNDLLKPQYIQQKEENEAGGLFPDHGKCYGHNKCVSQNQIAHKYGRKSWRAMGKQKNSQQFIKSGLISDKVDFSIKIQSIGNIFEAIDKRKSKHGQLEIFAYKYVDYTFAKMKPQQQHEQLAHENMLSQLADSSRSSIQRSYQSKIVSQLGQNEIQPIINTQMKEFNFHNFCSHQYQDKDLFAEKTFNILKYKGEEKGWEKKTDAITDHEKVAHKKEKRGEKNQASINPLFIQIEAALYLGNNQISENSYTKPQLFGQNIHFNFEELFFEKINSEEKIKLNQLPSNTRLCMQIILIPVKKSYICYSGESLPPKRQGYIYGTVSTPLYDFNRRLKQGDQRLLAWPLEKLDKRFICMADCYKYLKNDEIDYNFNNNLDLYIQLPTFHQEVYWDLGLDINEEHKRQYDLDQEQDEDLHGDGRDELQKLFVPKENKSMQQIREIINAFPREKKELKDQYKPDLIIKYRNFVPKLAMYLRAVDFTNRQQVAQCYHYLENSEQARNCKPEDALALLDAEFGDERVRLFAVTKLSELSDTYLSLYIPQLVQAVKYEVHHKSPLSEFLLEASLKNKRVVGHAFFWSIRAGLYESKSYERYYLILERFLMCCGQYKHELFKQDTMNRGMIEVHAKVMEQKKQNELNKKSKKCCGGNSKNEEEKKDDPKLKMEIKLWKSLQEQEFLIKLKQELILTDICAVNFDEFLKSKPRFMYIQNYQQQKTINEFNYSKIIDQVKMEAIRFEEAYKHQEDVMRQNKDFEEKQLKTVRVKNFPVKQAQDSRQQLDLMASPRPSEPIIWERQRIVAPFLPKKMITNFKKASVFLSAQVPLLIVANTESASGSNQETAVHILLKVGDDLRQDNLVLQLFRIMDEMWLENNLNMEMRTYKVLETGWKVGFIEFVDNSHTLSDMHKWRGWTSMFKKNTMYEWFKWNVYPKIFKKALKDQEHQPLHQSQQQNDDEIQAEIHALEKTDRRLAQMHQAFIKSVAGQCVATHVLGIRDRHSANFMYDSVYGRFFHIDFGHFMDHRKSKLGITRDREHFIYLPEIDHFLKQFHRLYRDYQFDQNEDNQLVETQTKMIKVQQRSTQRKLFKFKQYKEDESTWCRICCSCASTSDKVPIEDGDDKKYVILTDNDDYQPANYDPINEDFNHLKVEQIYNIKKQADQPSHDRSLEVKDEFEILACKAYQILREKAHVFINLCQLMVIANIEELEEHDVKWLITALKLELSEEQAQSDFKKMIQESLETTYRQADNWFHNYQDWRKKGN